MVWAASTVIALGASAAVVGGAAMSASAAGKASKAQADSANQANATTIEQARIAREDQTPWREAGGSAINELSHRLGLTTKSAKEGTFDTAAYLRDNPDVAADPYYGANPEEHYRTLGQGEGRKGPMTGGMGEATSSAPGFGSLNATFTNADFVKDPGYQFRLDEGMKGLTNSAAARGGLLSGAALKASSNYNQDYASNEFGNAFNRFNTNQTNQFNRLSSIAGVGQVAANQNGQNAMAVGQTVGNNLMGAGNARASGYVGQSNAINGAIGQGWNMYQGHQMMGMLKKPQNNYSGANAYSGWAGMGGFGDSYGTSSGE